jgi:sialate O-acetylesterase
MRNLYFAFMMLMVFACTTAFADVRLPKVISDGMVLQRETSLKIWGWADADEAIKLSLNQQTFETKAGADGKWTLVLPAQKAGGPFEMIIQGKNQITLKNILFGDVWLGSGQSNMETTMSRVSPLYQKEIAESANSQIRFFQVPVRWNYSGPQEDVEGGKWEEATPESILKYTAVGYFFARYINENYGVPVGILQCAAGGSPIEGWISLESLKQFPEQYKVAEQLSDPEYMKNLLKTEQEGQRKWFGDLADADLGHKGTPWYTPTFDDSAWPTFQLPAKFRDAKMDIQNGIVWVRRTVTLPASCDGKPALLEMGTIVDSDSVFVNGRFVGTTSYQYPPRRYQVPAGVLKSGENNITVKVIGQSFGGGFVTEKPYFLTIGDEKFDLKGTWKYQVAAKCGPSPSSTYFPGKPLGMFNAMLAPMTNYTVKGFLWYQGEANAGNAHEYTKAMTTLISEWRSLWGMGNLPFLYVQLPDYMEVKAEPSEGSWANMREAQLKTLSVPNTAMVVTLGLGEWNDIHPLRKKEVGERLAFAAEKMVYGKSNLVASGPLFKSMKVKKNKVEISFTEVGAGLTTNDGKELAHFAIAGADGKYMWAKAQIKGNKVIVWSDDVQKPVKIRYAWADNPAGANLYNKNGLPASPFQASK